jgi:FAD synthase
LLKETGAYYGFAKVYHEGKEVEEMVMSVGFNPFYNNTVRSVVCFPELSGVTEGSTYHEGI